VTEVEPAWGRTPSDSKFFLPVLLLVLILVLLLYLKNGEYDKNTKIYINMFRLFFFASLLKEK
jgi:hypothetical protein